MLQGTGICDGRHQCGEPCHNRSARNRHHVQRPDGVPYNSFYKAGGDSTLTDGVCGTWNNNDQRWQGFIRDIDLVVDLGQECEVSSVELSFLQILGPEIFLPAEVSVAPMDKADADGTKVSYTQLMDSTLADVPFVVQPYKIDLESQAGLTKYISRVTVLKNSSKPFSRRIFSHSSLLCFIFIPISTSSI